MFDSIIGQTQNDFSVEVADRDWRGEWQKLFAKQTTAMTLNLLDGIVVLKVRQLKIGKIQDIVFHMITCNGRKLDQIRIRPAKSKEKGAEYVFNDGELIDHSMSLDYHSKNVIIHELTFVFDRVNLYSPTNEQPISHYIMDHSDDEERRINRVLGSLPDVDDVDDPDDDGILKSNNSKNI